MRGAFAGLHPAVGFVWFAGVILFAMLFWHPLFLAVSLVCAVWIAVLLRGRRALGFCLKAALPLAVAAAVINPLFVHRGATVLFYLGGSAVTLEAACYGAAAGVMLAAVLVWFYCYNEVMTSDKFLYLFGRLIPATALLLSMTLRLVPRMSRQVSQIERAHRAVGLSARSGGVRDRARHGMRVLSILITWAMENAVETADAMKARGYGLPGRTSFSPYRFTARDAVFLALTVAEELFLLTAFAWGATGASYYPLLRLSAGGASFYTALCVWAALCLLPPALQYREEIRWRCLKSET